MENPKLQVKGTIKRIKEVQRGTSKAGKEWQKVQFILTNNSGYEGASKDFAFDVFGEKKVEPFLKYNKVGSDVIVSFDISTNEYNGNHYTSLNAYAVFQNKEIEQGTPKPTAQEVESDLPF